MVRPKKPIDVEELEKLAMMQCTHEEIAEWFNVSTDTLTRRYADILKRGKSIGVMSMKRQLFAEVQKGNLGAMVWWGKNYAGMSDKIEQTQTITQKFDKSERLKRIEAFERAVKEVYDIGTEQGLLSDPKDEEPSGV